MFWKSLLLQNIYNTFLEFSTGLWFVTVYITAVNHKRAFYFSRWVWRAGGLPRQSANTINERKTRGGLRMENRPTWKPSYWSRYKDHRWRLFKHYHVFIDDVTAVMPENLRSKAIDPQTAPKKPIWLKVSGAKLETRCTSAKRDFFGLDLWTATICGSGWQSALTNVISDDRGTN